VRLEDLTHQRQAEAEPSPVVVPAAERLHQLLDPFGVQPLAGVGHLHHDVVVRRRHLHPDVAAGWGVRQGVVDQG